MKLLHRIVAEILLLVHTLLFLLVLFGWLIPSLWYAYMAGLVATLISDAIFGYCLLSKWEFDLRRKYRPDIDYDYAWASYYTYKLTNHRISNKFYWRASIFALVTSLLLNIYFRFFY